MIDVSSAPMTVVRRLSTDELTPREMASLWTLFRAAWSEPGDEFTEEDFKHAVGGVHFVVEEQGIIVSHASVVERELHTGGHRLTTGYVEAVATLPAYRRRGFGNAVMKQVGEHIDTTFQLGALGSDLHDFYRRLGWTVWMGPTSVRTDRGFLPTPEEDGYVFVRLTPASPRLDLSLPISCDWRPGDVW